MSAGIQADTTLGIAARLAAEIHRRREEVLAAKIKARPRTSIWASQIPDCMRQGVYEFLNWQDRKLHDTRTQALFDSGHVQEAAYKAELRALGFELVEDQAPLEPSMSARYKIGGYIDCKIKWEGRRLPVEIKSMNQNVFDRIRDGIDGLDDMRDVPYMRKYLRQGQVYLLGHNEEAMLFALTDGRGGWKFIPMALDMDEAEHILQRVEGINAHVESKELPDRIPYDPQVCGKCPFLHICIPDIAQDPRVKFMDNPEIEGFLKRRAELEPAAKEFAALHERVKETFRGVELASIGEFIVSGKETSRKVLNLPDDIKKQYQVVEKGWRLTIERNGN